MKAAKDLIQVLHNPAADSLPDTAELWLRALGQATLVRQDGREPGRTRVVCTLLHGNELSGVRAVHRWLKEGQPPRCNTLFFIMAVTVALAEPCFSLRQLPGQRDMNRCFLPPYEDEPGRLVQRMLQLMWAETPEAVIDFHNTSGASPAFGVATHEDPAHESLLALFTPHLVITDLRLGALMELSDSRCPVVTIECGGLKDPAADEMAWAGLQKYLLRNDVLQPEPGQHIDLYHHPVRLELQPEAVLAFADQPVLGADLTIPLGLERYNFDLVERGTFIGWLSPHRGTRNLRLHNSVGDNLLKDYFEQHGNGLFTAQRLKLFMITSNPTIAASDCLLYAAPEREHTLLDT